MMKFEFIFEFILELITIRNMDERIQTVFDALRTVLRERCLGALPESVFETSCNMSHVFHPASSSGASALGFVLMIIPPHLGVSTKAARRTNLLLDVVGCLATATADCVRLVISSARTAHTFGHLAGSANENMWRHESVFLES